MLHTHHDPVFVALSATIAIFGSWTALELNRQARQRIAGGRQAGLWLLATALAMGLAIWSMHFVGMLGFIAGVDFHFAPGWTLLSLVLAVGSTALAFAILSWSQGMARAVLGGGLLMGSGICLMHYVGMAALRPIMTLAYDPWLVLLSWGIAVIAASTALATVLRDPRGWVQGVGAVVLGFAICAMHYTGMAAAIFGVEPHMASSAGLDRLSLGFGIASSTFLLFFLALLTVPFDRRLERQAYREMRIVEQNVALLNSILRELPVGVFVINADSLTVEFASREAERLAGAAMIGRRLPDPDVLQGLHPDGAPFARDDYPLVRTLRTGELVERQPIVIRRKDGTEFHAEVGSSPIRDDRGRIVRVVLALVDTTSRIIAEESLRQAQKLSAIGQLTGGIAHDFNNFLMVIRSSAELQLRPSLTEEKRRRYLQAIIDTADRAAKITSQLLAFSRRQTLKPERFELSERLDTIRDMLSTVAGARISIRIENHCPTCFVEADAAQFETAIMNMVINARDAMGGEGTVDILVDRAPDREDGQQMARVSIRDHGAGIAATVLQKIFDPFFTTKPLGEGTGLGLSQVFGFAKQSGGDISVESEPGEGTCFRLDLPVVEAPARASAPPVGQSAGERGRQLRVLVVEDNMHVGEFCVSTLHELGHLATWADTPLAALDMLRRDPVAYDLLLTDVVMPGMSGLELAQEVARMAPALPIILASGYSDMLSSQGSGGLPVLRKPYTIDDLRKLIDEVLQPAS